MCFDLFYRYIYKKRKRIKQMTISREEENGDKRPIKQKRSANGCYIVVVARQMSKMGIAGGG